MKTVISVAARNLRNIGILVHHTLVASLSVSESACIRVYPRRYLNLRPERFCYNPTHERPRLPALR
jgi:hypothetical protein